MARRRYLGWGLLGISLLAVVATFTQIGPIPQAVTYHQFADGRSFLAVPHFWNVVSNLLFLLSGGVGLWAVGRGRSERILPPLRWAYRVFFTGVMLVAVGSAYYHLAPANTTLVWDRLPMTIAFMALFAIIIGEHIEPSLGRRLLIPLLFIGGGSVGYWAYSESLGRGDLRPYLLVQFLPMVIIPLILLLFPVQRGTPWAYWQLLACYLLAKFCEHFDAAIFQMGLGISGHSLKHLLAALGILFLALSMGRRSRPSSNALS